MRVLIDTCVIIDAMQNREPFAEEARTLILAAANNQFIGCITAKSSTDIYYLMHRFTHDDKASRAVLAKLFTLFELVDTAGIDCKRAIQSEMTDYEDAIMVESAGRTETDGIVTRNTKDFEKSEIPIYTPGDFLKKLKRASDD